MKNIKGIFPGVFTVGNMFCGFVSILSSFDGEAVYATWLIILAADQIDIYHGHAALAHPLAQYLFALAIFVDVIG